ncbi:SDR family oxidoreductase [Streptomyces sp. OE57]|uniref:SDR family oxidoreductase n=1 Tax=Streptomyces lacaronensis TaxID=3379885 RepID=UPI0039B76257
MTHRELLFPLSTRSPAALRQMAARLADWLTGDGADTPLTDVAHTLALRREHLPERLALRAADRATLTGLLREAAEDPGPGPRRARGVARDTEGERPVFVFSGHGSQWDGMGARLLADEPAFAAVIDALEPVVRAENGHSLRALITEPGLVDAGMDQVQPAVYAVQVGLTAVWRARGVTPGAVIGHSMGEIAAAVAAGVLTAAVGARVVCRRSRLMEERLAGAGETALVELDADAVRHRLAGRADISVAVHASTRACAVAGDPAAVREFVAACREEGLLARLVPGVRIAAHSPLVDPVLGELTRLLDGLAAPDEPRLPFYGTALSDPRARPGLDAAYWAVNLRRPVRLVEAVRAAAEDGRRIFLEVSPHPVVAQSLLETLADGTDGGKDGGIVVHGTLRRDTPERTALLDAAAALHCGGGELDWETVQPPGRPAELPSYPWQHQTFARPRRVPVDSPAHPLLGARITLPGTPVRHVWQSRIGPDRLPWLLDHRVHGAAVLPGTGYAEMALAAACEAFDAPPGAVEVADLVFARLLPLSGTATVTTSLQESADGPAGTVEIVTGSAGTAVTLATARVSAAESRHGAGAARRPATGSDPAGRGVAGQPSGRPRVAHTPEEIYAGLRALGQWHGPAFASLADVRSDGTEAVTELRAAADLPSDARFRFHPAVLDACLHGLGALLPPGAGGTVVPTGMERLRVLGDPRMTGGSRVRLRPDGPAGPGLLADVDVLDRDGGPVAELRGVRLTPVSEEDLPVDVEALLLAPRWELAPPPAPVENTGRLLLFADTGVHDPRRETLVAALVSAGAPCDVVDWDEPWTDAAGAGGQSPAGVLLAAWGGSPDPEATPASARERAGVLITLVRGLLRAHEAAGTAPPPLTVLTEEALPVASGDRPDPVQAALCGLVRTLRLERAELRARVVDLDGSGLPPAAEFLAPGGPEEVAWRRGVRHAARLVPRAPAAPAGRAPSLVRPGGGYLISGGTRGLGLATAGLLAERGAGLVVLGGRRAPGPDAGRELDRIRALGTRVVVITGDVAEAGTAERMTAAVAAHGARLRGVVHAAAVLEDAMVTDADGARSRRVWAPKADGAWRLHRATADLDLDWWIGYSSLASLTGSPGQADYAAANAFLDAVVALRRAEGRPALAVNWGPWGGIGMVRDRDVPGFGKLTVREGFAALEELLARGAGQAGVARLSSGEFAAAHPRAARSFFLSALTTPEAAEGEAFDRTALDTMSADERREAVRTRVLRRIGQVLGFTDPDQVAHRPLVRLGLDSLAAVRIKNALREDFAVDLPVARLLQGADGAALADAVRAALDEGPAGEGRGTGGTTGPVQERTGPAKEMGDAAHRGRSRTTRTIRTARGRRQDRRGGRHDDRST